LRTLIVDSSIPPPVNDHRCLRCSLRPGCEPGMPTAVAAKLFQARPADLILDGDYP
jgi:CRISPR-associated exonuclease Cas4